MKRIACIVLLAAGCGNNGGTPDAATPDVTMATGTYNYFVVNSLQAPTDHTMFALDLNGDGKADNHLGDIISALIGENLDVQTAIDSAVAGGSVVLLFKVQATDLTTADQVGMTAYVGTKPTMAPDFGGMGMFTVDTSQNPAAFFGKIAGTKFSSNNPVTTTHPVTVTLKLPLIAGADPLSLTLNGAHLQANIAAGGATNGSLMNGQLNGSIKNSDVMTSIIPTVAQLLTQQVAGCIGPVDMSGAGDGGKSCSTAMTIDGIFDTGGCSDNGVMAVAKDGNITVCEVATNQLITNVLSPDVQIFDSSGNYKPNKSNAMKDSISLGLGFSGVGAAQF